MQSIYKTIDILSSSDYSQNSTVRTITDQFKISDELAKQFEEVHPIRNGMTVSHPTYPRVILMVDYTLDEAILLYRKLFYSTFERKPPQCDINTLLYQIEQSKSKFLDIIVDYDGAFESEHLHLIRCAFPHAIIYSIDILYEDLDLLICNINEDERKWSIIPVCSSTNKFQRSQLIESLRQEIGKSSSFWYGMNIWKLEFNHTIDCLQIYDPYTEILDLEKIHFIDTIDKCEIKPCSLFMAYNMHSAIPNVNSLISDGLIDRRHTIIDIVECTCVKSSLSRQKIPSDNNTRWDDTRAQLAQLRSIVGEKPKLSFSLPQTYGLRWLNNDMIAQLLHGKLNKISGNDHDDSMAHQFGFTDDFHSSILNNKSISGDYIDCIKLNSFMIKHNLTNITSSIVQQCIEQHIGFPWKNESINENLSKNFIKECLNEILGSITNLHIHIDSDDALKYSSEFIHQLKIENPTIEVEISFDDKLTDREEIYQSVIILTFECNQNYVLIYLQLDSFIEYISTCQSLEDIQTKIESSVTFSFSLSQGQSIKWHQNLSFIYISAHQNNIIEEIHKNILSKGLKDLIFITKKLSFLDKSKQPQHYKKQAILCFDFSKRIDNWRTTTKKYNQLDQWIWDKDDGIFTRPFITLYPNISNYFIDEYPQLNMRTNVMGIYNLLWNNVLIIFQWRGFFRRQCQNE
ncbi:unnamed protein product [Adineta steineri]|uniref:Uncharacterized protein n=3 Tax=Adineta steineri TaxID=433720 RepID=A0A814DJ06_9BILA|nr:unnamed protein product [Adineta steineri]